jgi:hypothetical protein
MFDKTDWWLEEHGLIMEAPGKLPAKKFVRDGLQGTGKGTTVERAKYVVTGDRDLTTVLTVYSDGRYGRAAHSAHAYSYTPTLTRLLLLHAYSYTPTLTRLLVHA